MYKYRIEGGVEVGCHHKFRGTVLMFVVLEEIRAVKVGVQISGFGTVPDRNL